jgi:hypothetical protein
MLGIGLALQLALATPAAPDPATSDGAAEATAADSAPWRDYRVRNVLHPELDTDFLMQWEPAFRRRNRLAGAGVGMLVGGTGLAFTGLTVLLTRDPRGAGPMAIGIGLALGGPLVGGLGTSSAAKILRASGIPVHRSWAAASLVVLCTTLVFPPSFVLTLPAAAVLAVVQAEMNGAAFRRVMQRPPARVALLPLSHGRPGLTLAASW